MPADAVDVGTSSIAIEASESAFPVAGILLAMGNHQLEKLTERSLQPQAGSAGAVYLQAVRHFPLNTELGFVIDSSMMAMKISRAFEASIPVNAHVVQLDDDGQRFWKEQRGDQPRRYDTEPHTSLLRRVGVLILSVLPIEWLL